MSTAFDLPAYEERARSGPCFVCATIVGEPDYEHEPVYEDAEHIAFLDRYPTLFGRTIVAPKRHVEDVVGGFSVDGYLALQAVVHRAASAVREVVPTERVYLLSLGSRDGNAHFHWHVAPLPPGVPYREQQYRALMVEHRGVVDYRAGEAAELAARLRASLGGENFRHRASPSC